MEIPKQLQENRFILIEKTSDSSKVKKPAEVGWTTDKDYSFDEISSKDIYKYGVKTGINKLMVVDCDTKEFQDACALHDKFKNTFTVQTANKKLNHYYFYVDKENPETIRLDANDIRVADIQGKGAQVIGPGSKLETIDSKYEVINDVSIGRITYDELIQLSLSMLTDSKIKKSNGKKLKNRTPFDNDEIDPVIAYIKAKITIVDLLEEWGININHGNNCDCPFHASENHSCFSYENHMFHCFHCERGGSIFHLVMEYYNCGFTEAKNILAEKVGIPKEIQKQAEIYAARAKKAEATEFLVQEFMKHNHIKSTRNDLKSEIWVYHDGIYIPHGKTYISQFCRAMLDNYYTVNICNLIIEKIRVDTYINEEDFFSINYEDEIPVKNGILNIKTLTMSKFNPDKIFFNKLPIYYNESEECPNILAFLESTLKDQKDIDTIQEAFGYSLWKVNKYKKAFLFVGKGDNGKSVLLDLYSALIGIDNISNVSLQEIDNEKFSVCNMFGKIANINADIGKTKLSETMMFKNLVAGDQIEAHRKFLSPIKFRNYSKLFFAANNVPETEDKSDGFFTRWSVVTFPYAFKQQTDYDILTEHEKKSGLYKIADPYIFEKITTKAELSGMLNWCLKGLKRLCDNKQFTNTTAVDEMKDFWERNESSVKAFVKDSLDFTYDFTDYMISVDLHYEYIEYCKRNKLEPEMVKVYNSILNKYPIKTRQKKFQTGSGMFEQKKIWEGLKLKE